MSTYPNQKRDRHGTFRDVPAMNWPVKRTASYSATQRALAASLIPYVCDDDTVLGRSEFLEMVRDRIDQDLARRRCRMRKRTMEQPCECGSKLYPDDFYDGHGIFLFYACSKCYPQKIGKYRPDIMERYECDEPLDAE